VLKFSKLDVSKLKIYWLIKKIINVAKKYLRKWLPHILQHGIFQNRIYIAV